MGRTAALLLALVAVAAATAPVPTAAKVTVHFVAHTHDDMGWLKTVDQYQYGLNSSIQVAHVNAIISGAVGSLLVNPERKFTYVEIGFFSRWWEEQTEGTRRVVRTLVGEGRLQFANGAWCMHDEAGTHFLDMIDQTTLGHRWLQRELQVVPRVGWQVDPFGHSATQATLLTARAGFLATYFGRVDYRDFAHRGETGRRHFWWQASRSMPELRTFTEIHLRETYCSPQYFRYDAVFYFEKAEKNQESDDIVDDVTSPHYNVPLVLERFKAELRRNLNVTRGDHVMWTMGCDFTYLTSELWFGNIDKLIRLVNADGEFGARYSTPYEYTLAKLQEDVVYDTKTDDFFPYASAANHLWTGYFTSRPNLKRLIRTLSSYWTAARQVEFLAGVPSGEVPPISDALAIAQHHDAVTGTAKQHVTFDYVKRLTEGYEEDVQGRLRAALATAPFGLRNAQHCPLSNVSVCAATAALAAPGAAVTVAVWNPSAHPVARAVVQLPVPRRDVAVRGVGVLRYAAVPSPVAVSDYASSNADRMPYTLAVELSLGQLALLTLETPKGVAVVPPPTTTAPHSSTVEVSNGAVALRFVNGLLARVTDVATGSEVDVVQDWCYFLSHNGDGGRTVPGGAYIMRTAANATCDPISTGAPVLSVIDSEIGIVEQRFGDDLVQRLTLRGDAVDMEFTSFGIPVADGNGRELMARFRTSVDNGDVFYTDSNGREMMRRRVDFRNDYPFTQTEPVAGNVYPVTTLLFINDTRAQFSVFPDAAVGGTSLRSGEVLIAAHRRLLLDDWKGVGEALNETEFVTSYEECTPKNNHMCGLHYGEPVRVRGTLTFAVTRGGPGAMRRVREQQDEKYYAPLVVYSAGPAPAAAQQTALVAALPPSLQLVTMQLFDERTLLVRLGHRYAVDEDAERSLPATVDLTALLAGVMRYTVTSIDEVALMASTVLATAVRTVTVRPMDVRAFVFHLQPRATDPESTESAGSEVASGSTESAGSEVASGSTESEGSEVASGSMESDESESSSEEAEPASSTLSEEEDSVNHPLLDSVGNGHSLRCAVAVVLGLVLMLVLW